MTEETALQAHKEGTVGVIKLDRPAKFNCLSMSLFKQLERALDDFEHDDQVAAVVICAAGKHFCTGAQLDEVEQVRGDVTRLREFLQLGHHVLDRLERSPLPVVAAIEGLCLAGGLELMLACDVVFAGKSARFGDQHAQFGLIPGWGGSQRLPKIIGQRRAMDLFFSARWVEAATAEQWGLVNYVVEDAAAFSSAMEYARTVAARNGDGIHQMKLLARTADLELVRAAKNNEITAATSLLTGDAVAEGLAAFREKRKPVFS